MMHKHTARWRPSLRSLAEAIRQAQCDQGPIGPLEAFDYARRLTGLIQGYRPTLAHQDFDGDLHRVDQLVASMRQATLVYWGGRSWDLVVEQRDEWVGKPFKASLDPPVQLWIPATDIDFFTPPAQEAVGLQDGQTLVALLLEEKQAAHLARILCHLIFVLSEDAIDAHALAEMSLPEQQKVMCPRVFQMSMREQKRCDSPNLAVMAALVARTHELDRVGLIADRDAGCILTITEPGELAAYAATLAIGEDNLPQA